MTEDITPIRKQYLEIKRQYPNAILLFRLGDFYETFDQDAEITARELDIVLTSRPIGKGQRAPLAGIPYHAIENYLARLINKGYHVAICEQVGETPIKGLFPRQVVRVVTPGTIIDPGLLPSDANNYLASVVIQENRSGISYVDVTTGEFSATEFESSDPILIRSELLRLHPAEIIHPDNLILPDGLLSHLTPWNAWHFELGKCHEILLSHFNTTTLDGFGLKDLPLATRAAGAIIQYIQGTEGAALNLLTSFRIYNHNEFMTIDPMTRRNLELTETLHHERKGSLLDVLDCTVTPMGKRLIHQWINQPLLEIEKIHARQNGIEFFKNRSFIRAELRASLKPIADLERLINRILANRAQPRDLVALRDTLQRIPIIQEIFIDEEDGNLILPLQNIHQCNDELKLLCSAIADDPPSTLQNTGIIRLGYSSELDSVIESSRQAREWINNLESVECERTGIKSLKVGYNKIFGYYIEISHSNASLVPQEYIRKQTLVNAERYITPEMKEYETIVLNAEEDIRKIELRLFREICKKLAKSVDQILETSHLFSELDVLSSLAEVAAHNGYIRPEIQDSYVLDIHEGRHPVVELMLNSPLTNTNLFIPNDTVFDQSEIIRVITGPNMSGKSTYIRQVALIVLMAQIGSFVPAKSARIGLVDRIFTRIGAQDEIHAGQSTFMVEMIETANILHHATPRSLLILDEIGRGTSTYDGVSIAWAVVEYIHNHPQIRAKTLFATHYHELTQLSELLPGVRNFNVAVTETDEKVVFLYKIVPGGANRSYGIHVAQLAGLPKPVIQRATEILSELENSSKQSIRVDSHTASQIALFPEINPFIEELNELDINTLSPIEALNKLYEWQRKYSREQ